MTLKLTLIRGLPGSGKSTLARTLPAHHFEADMYFVDQKGGYFFQPYKLPLAHQWCKTETQRCLASGHDVVVSNTFVRRWEIEPYYKLAERYNAKFEVIECHGNFGNIHGVEQQTIEKMKQRWQSW